jgi:hypothetical protein
MHCDAVPCNLIRVVILCISMKQMSKNIFKQTGVDSYSRVYSFWTGVNCRKVPMFTQMKPSLRRCKQIDDIAQKD